jgi:hypothetical protein
VKTAAESHTPPAKPVIAPSIGLRVLLFVATMTHNGEKNKDNLPVANSKNEPFDAGIAYVWSEDGAEMNRINVGYKDHSGNYHAATSVALYDRAQNEKDAHGKETYAVWMDYQFKQAQRAADPVAERTGRPPDVELRKADEQ